MLRGFACLLAVALVGCAVDKDEGEPLNRADTGGLTADVLSIDATSDTFLDRDAACGIETAQATLTPLNLYVMFDKSSSMGPDVTSTKWAGAKKGMTAFVNDGASTGLRIALNFFPRPVDATPSCDSAAYMAPRVAYDVLPANAPKIIAAIEAERPDGFNTPIYPALGGSLRASINQVASRPGEAGAVVLVTDGEPQGPAAMCGAVNPEDPAVIANLAATAYMNNGIRTFVVGLPGVNVTVANQIAAAGGSTAAVLATDPTKVEESFRDALAVVRGKALSCELPLPSKVLKGEISYALVNVLYTKGGTGASTGILQDAACTGGEGWHYDSTTMPTKVILCPKTCGEVQADPKAKVEILLGCKTAIK